MANFYKSKAPSLPNATGNYSQTNYEQLLYTLRIYFNKLDSSLLTLANFDGGRVISYPYGQFISTITQNASADDTATEVGFDTALFSNSVNYDATNGILVDRNGIYRFQYTLQFANNNASTQTAYVWLTEDGTIIDNSSRNFDVPAQHSSVDGQTVAVADIMVNLTGGQYVKIWWASDQVDTGAQDGILLQYSSASASPYDRPAVPSASVSVTFVSAPP